MSKDRIKQLVKEIRYHNELYWNHKTNDINSPDYMPGISDTEYDQLVNELLQLDPNSTVPYEFAEAVDAGKAIKHTVMMLSMNKAYSADLIVKWANNLKGDWITLSPKMDGSACSIVYENGKIQWAATRGNGKVGEDVTTAIKLIRNIPKRIDCKDPIEIRGEVCMNLSDFKKLTGGQANPRNVAAGAMKRKNPNDPKHEKTPLTFYAYNVIGSGRATESDKFKFLREQGFRHVATKSVLKKDLEQALKDMEAERDSWDYEVDGLIITVGDVAEQDTMGSTRHHPKYAIALKFQGDAGQTVLKEIEWSTSRTSQITPVGKVEPVNLSGATVSRVSLHNLNFIKSMNLTLNALIEMVRSGMVIPQVTRVIKDGDKAIEIPKTCPSCGAQTEVLKDFLYCTGNSCPAQIAGQIEHFVKVLEIDGLGSKIIDQICRSGVKNPAHLFMMKEGGLIRNVERMGEKGAKKIIANIQAKKEIPLNVFLRSLGIHELGNHVSEELAKKYDDIEDVLKLKVHHMLTLPKVGDTIANSVVQGLKENNDLIRSLLKYIVIKPEDAANGTGPLSGQSFVFTGRLVKMKRNEAQKAAKALGADTPSSVKKDLTYLVVGDGPISSKQEKADKYNKAGSDIKIISEDDFGKMVQGN